MGNSSGCTFQEGIELFATMLLFSYFNGIFKVAVGPELEKRLGRKVTDQDWQVCLEEVCKKAEFDTQQKMLAAQQARINDQKIIHNFVWRDNSGEGKQR
jgi:hypothetical protein